jgi:Fe-S oxidoreductase
MAEITPEITDLLKMQGGQDLEHCYQCGTCTAVCPWNIAGNFGVRSLIHQAQLGMVDFGDEDIWKCVGCRSCAQACPRGVDIPKMIRALRRVISEVGAGSIPRSLRMVAANLAGVGNPMGELQEERTKWALDLDVKTYTPGTDMLLFTCCYQAYDNRCRKAAQSMIKVLNSANTDFGILDGELSCCGESIRKAGKESLFVNLASRNIQTLNSAGVKKILVGSPHCYNALKVDYPEFGANFEVIHIVQYLDNLINAGKIKFHKNLDIKVAYHDSCCLGRYQGIYEEPRRILHSIPGVDLIELPDNRANSLCCGGCSGGLWLESKSGERFAELRISQAIEGGAQVLAVSCPYCMTMFEDAVLTLDKAGSIEIRDVVELVSKSIE